MKKRLFRFLCFCFSCLPGFFFYPLDNITNQSKNKTKTKTNKNHRKGQEP